MFELKINNGIFSEKAISFTAPADNNNMFFSFSINFPSWEDNTYIFIPACAYNGNKMEPLEATESHHSYTDNIMGADFKPRISHNIPALRKDGSGVIEVTTGDTAVPCVGIFYPHKKQGFLLFTEQDVKGKNLGITVQSGCITVSYPSNRNYIYRNFNTKLQGLEQGIPVKKGEVIESAIKILTFTCEDIPAFYDIFFQNRKCLLDGKRAKNLYTSKRWDAVETHFNSYKWSGEYYGEGTTNTSLRWCSGFVGTGQNASALYLAGNKTTRERAIKTIDYLTAHQGKSGFYIANVNGKGEALSDLPLAEGKANTAFVSRKAGEMLIAVLKSLEVMPKKKEWEFSAKKCANALVELYKKHKNFCHYVDWEDGTALISGSSAGAIGVAGLVKAWQYFGDAEYLEIAKEAMEYYYENYLKKGVTEGAPTDILSAPNSEASYALAESAIALYEVTHEKKHLAYAKTAVHQFSSWVMSYRYRFPSTSEYGRIGLNTVGSVFASVQNKHSSPGICTFSGDAIYRLYKLTGDKSYLELILDIAMFIPQCIPTDDNPIYAAWEDPITKQMPGAICERVNTSDWEGMQRIGNIFRGSCWCESSYIMTVAELIDKEEFKES